MLRRRQRPALLACALACASCAAGHRLNVPVPRAGETPLRWPPVPVDAYETTDGRRHELPGGWMVEAGDSLLFLPETPVARPALLSAQPVHRPVTVHRDSVRSIAARLQEGGEDTNALGLMLGGAVMLAVLSAVLWSSGVIPWLIWSGS